MRWHDWAGFSLGPWLAIPSWVLGFSDEQAATANAAVIGILVTLFAAWAMSLDKEIARWWHTHVAGH